MICLIILQIINLIQSINQFVSYFFFSDDKANKYFTNEFELDTGLIAEKSKTLSAKLLIQKDQKFDWCNNFNFTNDLILERFYLLIIIRPIYQITNAENESCFLYYSMRSFFFRRYEFIRCEKVGLFSLAFPVFKQVNLFKKEKEENLLVLVKENHVLKFFLA